MSNYFYDGIIPNYVSGSKSIIVDPTPASSTITLTDGTTTNTLTQSDWTGNIRTVNTTANLTHYLNFSDQAATGQGHPQKAASLNCNPSTGLITATTFNGSLIGNASTATTSTNIITANDNTSTDRYLVYVSGSGTAAPRIDITTGPLTYNPGTGVLTATSFNGQLTGKSDSTSTIALTSDDTSGSYFIPFAKTVSLSSILYVDNTTTPLSYNPSTSRLSCNEFSGNLLGNATSSTSVTTTNDNTAIAYNLVFCSGPSTNASLLVDSVTGPLTYNPSDGTITCTSITADIRCASVTTAATFAGTTLTFSGGNLTFRCGTITFTGAANTVTTLSLSSNRNNAIYYVSIRNNGSLGASFLTGLGATILTTYSSTVVVPAGTSALMSIVVCTLNGVSTSMVSIDLLT